MTRGFDGYFQQPNYESYGKNDFSKPEILLQENVEYETKHKSDTEEEWVSDDETDEDECESDCDWE